MKKAGKYKRRRGTAMDMMTVGICVLAMTVMMMAYLENVWLLDKKAQVSQIARKYILRMETVGYLTGNERMQMAQELQNLGASQLDFTGSTMNRVDYGSPIFLTVHGKLSGLGISTEGGLFHTVYESVACDFEETRMSTAKN